MQGRFHDGRTSLSQTADLAVAPPDLVIRMADETLRWPLAQVITEPHGDQVRLGLGRDEAARLTVSTAEWRAACQAAGHASDAARHRIEMRLVGGLAAVAAAVAAVVFVVLPAASRPLAAHTPPALESKIGENFNAQVSLAMRPCPGTAGQAALTAFGERLGAASGTPFHVQVRAVEAPIVNAFALPGGSVLVTDELIDLARTPDELSAVLAHEIAHVQRRHVMQAVYRSLGLGLLLDAVVGGGSGAGQQAILLAGSVTNLRYSRGAEAEADERGQRLLEQEGLSSEGMSPFFARLAAKGEGRDAAAVKELLSDHPDIRRRAEASRARARPGAAAFTPQEWRAIKTVCVGMPDRFRRLRKLF